MLLMLYTGRHYYWNTLRRSLFFRTRDNIEDHAIFGMRIFLIGTFFFIVQLVWLGIDWQLAIPYTLFIIMVHVAMSRMVAETGVFNIGTYVYPGVMLWAFLGASAMGPRILLILFLVSTMLVSGPGWAPMPFIVQAFKFVDMSDVKIRRVAQWGVGILVLSALIAIPATIYWSYDSGAPIAGYTCQRPHQDSGYIFNVG